MMITLFQSWGCSQDIDIHFESNSKYPIYAWGGLEDSEKRYLELKEAGINHIISWFDDIGYVKNALDYGEKAGVKLIVGCPELRTQMISTVEELRHYPALSGYFLKDEPNSSDFERLAEQVETVQKLDSINPAYINLFPTYASRNQLGSRYYRDYVENFVETVKTKIISFDHYPITNRGMRGSWFKNLEIISHVARKEDLPFWAFALTVAHEPYPLVEMEHLRLQVYSNLVYGASALQYFTYWTPSPGQRNFREGPIKADGSRSIVYESVKNMNRELQEIAPIFQNSRVISVGHLGKDIPDGTRRYEPCSPVVSISSDNKGAIISTLRGEDYTVLAIVNGSYKEGIAIKISFDKSKQIYFMGKRNLGKPLDGETHVSDLPPGDIVIYSWSN